MYPQLQAMALMRRYLLYALACSPLSVCSAVQCKFVTWSGTQAVKLCTNSASCQRSYLEVHKSDCVMKQEAAIVIHVFLRDAKHGREKLLQIQQRQHALCKKKVKNKIIAFQSISTGTRNIVLCKSEKSFQRCGNN